MSRVPGSRSGRTNNRVDASVTRVLQVLGDSVKHWREQRKLTQSELAKASGLNRETIVRLEAAEPSRVESLVRIAGALGIAPVELFAPSPTSRPIPDPGRDLLVLEDDMLRFFRKLELQEQRLAVRLLQLAAGFRLQRSSAGTKMSD